MTSSTMVQAQGEDVTPEVPPLQGALHNAREAARNNDANTAVAELQKMADAGFTSVGVITGASPIEGMLPVGTMFEGFYSRTDSKDKL